MGFKEIYDYRHMLWGLVKRDLKGRYKGSVVGFLWNFMVPMAQIAVYILVFTEVFRMGIPNYYAYLIAGMMPWIFFSEALGEGTGCMVSYSEMVKKLYFPRAILPLAVVTSRLVNFLITYSIVIVLLVITGFSLNVPMLMAVFVAIFILYVFVLGLVMALSTVNAHLRDTQHIITILLMIWVWLTPIMYLADFPQNVLLQGIIHYNPMTYIISLFQDLVYFQVWPSVNLLVTAGIIALLSFLLGSLTLRKLEKGLAEAL